MTPPTARQLLNAEMLRREAQSRMPDGVEVTIYGIFHNPWTGRQETYLRIHNTKDTHEDPPAE